MDITDVRVRKIAKEGKMKAVVSITLDNVFVVHDIKVIEGEKGLFIAMPSKKTNIVTLPIRSTPRQEIICRKLFLRHMKNHSQSRKWNKRSKEPKVLHKPWAFLCIRELCSY